MVCCHSS